MLVDDKTIIPLAFNIGVEDTKEVQEVVIKDNEIAGCRRNGQSWSRLMILDWISPRDIRFISAPITTDDINGQDSSPGLNK